MLKPPQTQPDCKCILRPAQLSLMRSILTRTAARAPLQSNGSCSRELVHLILKSIRIWYRKCQPAKKDDKFAWPKIMLCYRQRNMVFRDRLLALNLWKLNEPQRKAADIVVTPAISQISHSSRTPSDMMSALEAGGISTRSALPEIRRRIAAFR
jgi:hypothetical protein